MFKIKMYSPSKRSFKRVISMDATHEFSDTNLASEEDQTLAEESEYSEWNGFSSDAEPSNDASASYAASPVSSEQQERENPTFIPESSFVEAIADALEYQRNEEPIDEGLFDLNSDDESLDELPTPLSVIDQVKQSLNEDADESDALFNSAD